MNLDRATAIAERVKAQLAPHCDRIEISGSIRRRKPDVGDIEIVCIPKTDSAGDLFGHGEPIRSGDFIQAVRGIGNVCKGDLRHGKYIQVRAPEGIQIDLFTARPENWGLIYAIRTGSADFSHHVLACGWVRNGYKSVDGMLTRAGSEVPIIEESDLFLLAGVPWIDPEAR